MKLKVASFDLDASPAEVMNTALDYFAVLRLLFDQVEYADRPIVIPDESIVDAVDPVTDTHTKAYDCKKILRANPAEEGTRLVILTNNDLAVINDATIDDKVLPQPTGRVKVVGGRASTESGSVMLQIHKQDSHDYVLDYILGDIHKSDASAQVKAWAEAIVRNVYRDETCGSGYALTQIKAIEEFIGLAHHTINFQAVTGNQEFPKRIDHKTSKGDYELIHAMEGYVALLLALNVYKRNVKIAVLHEVLHTLGVEHCQDRSCLMYEIYPFYDGFEKARQAYAEKKLSLPNPNVTLCLPHSDKLIDLTVHNLKPLN